MNDFRSSIVHLCNKNRKCMSITYSILDLASVVGEDSIQQTFEKSVQSAQAAEKLGFERYWFSEHHNFESVASAATSLLIGHIAGKTKHIRVGSGGIMLPNHSTLIVAEQFGTLEEMYPGRIDLGLGRAPGTDTPAVIAIRGQHPGAPYDFKKNILQLQQYFREENRHSKVRAIPGEGLHIPIWILGSSTASARLAAELGLPYAFASHFAPQQIMHAFEIYHKQFQPSDQLQEPYAMACLHVIAAEEQQEAEYLATSMQQAFSQIVTDQRSPLQPPKSKEEMQQFWTPKVRAAVQQMTSLAMIGDKKHLEENLSYFIKQTGIKEVMILSQIYDLDKKHRSMEIVSEVMKNLHIS